MGETGFVHSTTITGLNSETIYYFKINSGGKDFDNNALPWQTKAAPSLGDLPSAKLISGSVVTAAGSPAKGVLVFDQLAGANILSAVTSDNGNWVIIISNALNQDLNSKASFNESSTILEISVQGGPTVDATAQILLYVANWL